MTADERHLASALALGARSLGETWPNPAVGCVILDREGRVAGRGRTRPGGRPHAETEALAMAGEAARGGTACVTLEPCSHTGQTPPCAEALVAAGIARVVGGLTDPDPRVDGRGFARLRAAGVAVEPGLLPDACAALAAGFVSRVTRGRPRVTLKMAASLDGRIAIGTGESRWITDAAARRRTQAARVRHDAILVGVGTAIADDPRLTVRLDGARARPLVRVVADRTLRLPPEGALARTARATPLWVLHGPDPDGGRAARLDAAGVRRLATDGTLADGLRALGDAGLTTVLAEGGATLAAALLRARLVDALLWFTAPLVIGGDGVASVGPLAAAALADAPRFAPVDIGETPPDIWRLMEAGGT